METNYGWNCAGCDCPGDVDDGGGDDNAACDETCDPVVNNCCTHADCGEGNYCYAGWSANYCWNDAGNACASYDDSIDSDCDGDEDCDDCPQGCGAREADEPAMSKEELKQQVIPYKGFVKPEGSNSSLGRETKTSPKFESKLQRAGSVKLIPTAEGLRHEADGFVGFEITLEHGADFEIDVTSKGFIADYNTVGNTTKVVVVNNETSELFSSTGDFEIVDVIAGTTGGIALSVNITSIPTVFGLSGAYPNPFNPATSIELAMPQDGFVSVKVYNLMGQVVATLHEGNLTANSYSFTWDAGDVASGMYLLQAEVAGNVDIQKIMLMK
jgi:hypothetical protein